MLYLYCALSLLMSAGSMLQGASKDAASSSCTNPDSAMLTRMTAKAAERVYQTDSEDSIDHLIAQKSQYAQELFSPEQAVEAQQKFNATLASGPISSMILYAPVASTSSELQQCFKRTRISVPSDKPLTYMTIMLLTPSPAGNKLEAVMLASSNKPLLQDVTAQTVLGALNALTGSAYSHERLLYSVLGDTAEICKTYRDCGGNLGGGPYASMLCGDLPFYSTSDIQGSSFEFTSQAAPADPVLMAQSLLPAYFEFEHPDMARYVGALDTYGTHFAADEPHHPAPVWIPDVKRLQAYLARTDIPAAIIVNNKVLTDPARVLRETLPTTVSYLHPHEWQRGMMESPAGGVVIPQPVRLKQYLAKLPDACYVDELTIKSNEVDSSTEE
jgi:hypothetical protein